MAAGNAGVDDRLATLGFRFNPFEYLESSGDPCLGWYLIEPDSFDAMWGASSSFISAPSGAGKTALRLLVANRCWTQPTLGLLTVIYPVGSTTVLGSPLTLYDHYPALLQSLACALFVSILIHPERLLNAERSTQRETVRYLDALLPASLTYYQRILQTSPSPNSLIRRFDPSPLPLEAPPHDLSESLVAVLADRLPPPSETQLEPMGRARFDALVSLILDQLGFSAILLFLDDLDAVPEMHLRPQAAYEWLAPLLDVMPWWAERRIYLKGFFPPSLSELISMMSIPVSVFYLQWQPASLIQMLQRRIFAATRGRYGSFDAISLPSLHNVEARLIERVKEILPREVLRLAMSLLQIVLAKDEGVPRITADDLEQGTARYLQARPSYAAGVPV